METGVIYFNEFDPYPAQWLRNLFPKAVVDERSIHRVKGSDLVRFKRVHLFAGIGGWEYALRLAEWPKEREVWTGSCPCQPFSLAGERKGTSDSRHLWPEFLRLISKCNPSTLFGEQVASPDGREWLDGLRVDLEALDYAVACADLCAASVGSPQVRQRLFWAATLEYPNSTRLEGLHDEGWEIDLQSAPRNLRRHWETEPSMDRVANGIPNQVGRLRAYGNAIVPQVAAIFVRAFLESE